jgi:hypothetical protein
MDGVSIGGFEFGALLSEGRHGIASAADGIGGIRRWEGARLNGERLAVRGLGVKV